MYSVFEIVLHFDTLDRIIKIIVIRKKLAIWFIALCSNPLIDADAKDFVVLLQFSLFCQINWLNLDDMTAGYLYSSIVLVLRGEGKQKNMLKTPVFELMQPVPSSEENFKYYL